MTQPDFSPITGLVLDVSRHAVQFNFGYGGEVWVPKDCIKEGEFAKGDIKTWHIHTWILRRKHVLQ